MAASAAYRVLFVAGLAAFFLSVAWGLVFAYLREERLPDVREALQTLDDHRAMAALQPRSAASWSQLGEALARDGQVGEATRAWERAAELDPEALEARVWLARVYLREGRADEARRHARAALERGAEIEPALLQALELGPAGR